MRMEAISFAHEARVDSLTGCLDRGAFLELVREEGAREEEGFALVLVDLAGLRDINDLFGHLAGDEMLRSAGGLLGELPGAAAVGRLGGGEFGLLLSVPGAGEVASLATEALDALTRARGPAGPIGATAGHAVWAPGDDVSDLLERAAAALAEAKRRRPHRAPQLRASRGAQAGEHVSRAQLTEALEEVHAATTAALAAALEARDGYTAEHARSVVTLAVAVGEELGLDPRMLRDVRLGATFHDIGKIAVPDAILHKPGRLTAEEFEIVKRHPATGERILAPVPFLAGVRRIVRHDHERWDGTGYPDGLRGEEIPVGARIVFVVDAFDAMTSDRPYRAALTRDEARARLRATAGTQFDPEVVAAFERVLDRARV
jgi:two-component system, cell cycle response regulator